MKEKYRVTFSASDGRTAALELCCFCQKVPDINHPEICKHFSDDYVDNERSGFVKVNDVGKRLYEALDSKCSLKENGDQID